MIDAAVNQPSFGFANVMKGLLSAGQKLGEGRFVDGGSDGPTPFGETVEQLETRRSALVMDKRWAARFNANEPTAVSEYEELNRKIAAGYAKAG
jgi:hypothetical protein